MKEEADLICSERGKTRRWWDCAPSFWVAGVRNEAWCGGKVPMWVEISEQGRGWG